MIPDHALRVLWAFASASAPHEACGLLAGRFQEETEYRLVMQLENIAKHPAEQFEFHPTSFYPCLAQFDGWTRIGLWHSHPHGRPDASRQDYKLMRIIGGFLPMAIVGWKPEPCVALYDFTEEARMIRRVWYGRIPT